MSSSLFETRFVCGLDSATDNSVAGHSHEGRSRKEKANSPPPPPADENITAIIRPEYFMQILGPATARWCYQEINSPEETSDSSMLNLVKFT